ncbi:MAG: FAD-dependent oxidoreductase [Nitriliruptorales bacterium]|nr:FAD-dependent oxidoreductase [Nitriliruptorales bacterium]
MERLVVVGGGLAAARFVQAVRRLEEDVPVTLVSAEPHLPYDRPPLSKKYLAGEFAEDRLWLAPEDLWGEVDTRLGVPAVGLSVEEGTVTLADGTQVGGDHVVLATGSAPRTIPGWPASERVLTLRTLDDSRQLGATLRDASRLAIVGAGFIGCEVAATARGMGVDVTVVDVLEAPCERGLGAELGARVAALHRDHGVDLRLGVGVDEVEDVGDGVRLQAADGEVIEADAVLVAIGAAPVTDWLASSGLSIDDGIVCDDHLRAANGGGRVWAVGDVARWESGRVGGLTRVEHWTNAIDQAEQVAHNILETERAGPYDPVQYVWSDQYDALLQVVGDVAGAERVETVHGALDDRKALVAAVTNDEVVGLFGWSNARMLMQCRRLLDEGVTIDALRTHLDGLAR